jgi:hypothetical protein
MDLSGIIGKRTANPMVPVEDLENFLDRCNVTFSKTFGGCDKIDPVAEVIYHKIMWQALEELIINKAVDVPASD